MRFRYVLLILLLSITSLAHAISCVDYCKANGWSDFGGLGYAKIWYGAANGKGYSTGNTPIVGAVLVWKGWIAKDDHGNDIETAGHVAVVASIVSDSEITVNHANWAPTKPYEDGKVYLDSSVKDISGGGWTRVTLYDGSPHDVYGFIYPKGDPQPVDLPVTCQGSSCWAPQGQQCENAAFWCTLEDTAPKIETRNICSNLQSELYSLSQDPNPQQALPENRWWNSWWRSLRKWLGIAYGHIPSAYAGNIRTFTVNRTVSLTTASSGNVFKTISSGNGKQRIDATGPAQYRTATDNLILSKPDFIIDRLLLKNTSGVEQYAFSKTDTLCMEAKLKNIGQGKIENDDRVRTRLLLSKGHKEDPHGEWKGIASFDTRGDHVEQGESHTETVCVNLATNDFIQPGRVYNIIAYADRTEINNNDGGDYQEEHENNNATDEAVFTIQGVYDFSLDSMAVTNNQPKPGETIHVTANMRNLLNQPSEDVEISFFLSLNEDWNNRWLAETKAVPAASLTDQATLSITADVLAPSTGEYTLWTCVNPHGSIAETQGGNNCQSLWIGVLDIPSQPTQPKAPKAIITIINMMM